MGTDEQGRSILFQHPVIQTICMFLGESLCFIPYLIKQLFTSPPSSNSRTRNIDAANSATRAPSAPVFRRTITAFAIPAACDMLATTLLNLGLYYTFASVFQMLRGTLVIFAGMLTILVLRRRLRIHNWLGIVFITAGAALVGASSIIYAKDQKKIQTSAPNPLLGNILVILAQLLNALQFIIEEKFLRSLYDIIIISRILLDVV